MSELYDGTAVKPPATTQTIPDTTLTLAARHVAARLNRMLLRLADRQHPEGWYPNPQRRRQAEHTIRQTLRQETR